MKLGQLIAAVSLAVVLGTAGSAAAVVLLDIGDAVAVPGGMATVAVTIDGITDGGIAINNAQLDMLFDPFVFETPDPQADCLVAPALGSFTHTASLLMLSGEQRLRLSVIDTVEPLGGIADGPMYTCILQIRPDAPLGLTPLQAVRLNVGDTVGTILDSMAGNGVVDIVAAEVSPPVPCAGDCNGDGQVLGNEVTLAVNILAGVIDVSACPSADIDGDQEVVGTEVTAAIRNAASGCTNGDPGFE